MNDNNQSYDEYITVLGPYPRKEEFGGGHVIVLASEGEETVEIEAGVVTPNKMRYIMTYTKEKHEQLKSILDKHGVIRVSK